MKILGKIILFYIIKKCKKELNYKLIIVKQKINMGVKGAREVDLREETKYNLA